MKKKNSMNEPQPEKYSHPAPKVSKEARHGNPDANPHSQGPNEPKTSSRKIVKPPAPRGESPKSLIPFDGTVEEQLGHPYPRLKPKDLMVHENQGAARKAVEKQIQTATPTKQMVENNPNKFPKSKRS